MGGKFHVTAADRRDKARKAQLRARRAENCLRIEGEYVTQGEIAARIGKSEEFVVRRLRELRNASGPITWARLAA